MASAAVAADAAILEGVEALRASTDGGSDVAVGSSSADADDHVVVVLRLSLDLRNTITRRSYFVNWEGGEGGRGKRI